MSDVIDRITDLVNGFDARVQAAPADAWGNASPCEGWTARDVAAHVSDNLLRIGGALSGTENQPVAADEDILAAWARAKGAFLDSLPGADMTMMIPGGMGPMPAEQVIGRLIATDTLVHTWDLARAVGGDESLPTDAVDGAYSGLKPLDAMIRRPGVFEAKLEAPEGADLQTEFLAFLGRKV